MKDSLLSRIPNMNSLLEHMPDTGIGRERLKLSAQRFLDELRSGILAGSVKDIPSLDECAGQILDRAQAEGVPRLRRVINATGIILHTNLGRAPLGAELAAAAADSAGYCNLEYDLDVGQRGDRFSHLEPLICEITGAEAAIAVNNNAAAVFLMLSALAKGKRVAISRGELVEIGGSFRIPEIIGQSGAELVEVGTTNRTRLSDYAAAVEEKGAEVLLKVHTSNYRIVGFTESVSASELAAFGRKKGLPVLYDMGACLMIEPGRFGLPASESARDGIASGADLICFSGDKLLGAAQAGILAGREALIARMKKHPLARILRPDKLTLSALEAAMRLYRYPEEALRRIPILAMLSARPDELRRRAGVLAERLRPLCPGWDIGLCETADEAGGGSLPNDHLPGWAVMLKPAGSEGRLSVEELDKRLRHGRTPVILRIHDGAAQISLRTLLPGEDDELAAAVSTALTEP